MEDLDMVLHLLKDTSYTVGLEELSQEGNHSTSPEVIQQINVNCSLEPKKELNPPNMSMPMHDFKLTEEEMKRCYNAVYGC